MTMTGEQVRDFIKTLSFGDVVTIKLFNPAVEFTTKLGYGGDYVNGGRLGLATPDSGVVGVIIFWDAIERIARPAPTIQVGDVFDMEMVKAILADGRFVTVSPDGETWWDMDDPDLPPHDEWLRRNGVHQAPKAQVTA